MTEDKSTPRPCPFCGSDDLCPSFHQSEHELLVCVACDKCDTEGPTVIVRSGLQGGGDRIEDIRRAHAAWNKRSAVNSLDAHRECVEALRKLRLTSRVLLQNAEGCAVNHYELDFQQQGLPGWLRDSEAVIKEAEAALAKLDAALANGTVTEPASQQVQGSSEPIGTAEKG